MRIAVMQPYIFPYIGYFQLINSVDKFVFYDDVDFIKQGWVNRNNILVNGQKFQFTIPVKNISSNNSIANTQIDWSSKLLKKFIKTLKQSYKKAPYYERTMEIVEQSFDQKPDTISNLCANSTNLISEFLELKTKFELSSEKYNQSLGYEKEERLISICELNSANIYINPIGGQELYEKEYFRQKNITLYFLKSKGPKYTQFGSEFISGLSIIDILMFNEKKQVQSYLTNYDLI
ncbi:WbqC family protein [Membranihabitans maritimus]|uniref:WbqC family protein n=1 Tax=Membranihabitans maritimus TaxID=2904244 RepID=UPI001F1B0C0E|nr:WbqC family protein [Membranihabitans maritimus]